MGSELKDSPPEKQKTVSEILEESCPYYLSIGLSYEDFWDGDPEKAKYFRKAEKIRLRRENQSLWMQGLYIYHAIGDISPILRFNMGKPVKPDPYLSEPFALDNKEQKEREDKKREDSMMAMRDMLSALSTKRKKEGDESDGRACRQ